jgi:hypothetical protein
MKPVNFMNSVKKADPGEILPLRNYKIYKDDIYGPVHTHRLYKIPTFEKIYPTKSISNLSLNNLEAVFICITLKEIESSRFDTFVENMTSTIEEKLPLHCVLVINKFYTSVKDKIDNFVNIASKKFDFVDIINLNIHPIDDIYIQDSEKDKIKTIPKYGFTSGPNIMFLNSMQYASKYNTVLLLESDCTLSQNWAVACINYVKYSGTFLVSGSSYDGKMPISFEDKTMFFHINGVAFYKTGDPVFKNLLGHLDSYILKIVPYYGCASYDLVITQMIFDMLSSDKSNYAFWRYMYRNITRNTLIINASTIADKDTPLSTFYDKFPSCVILHKKT